MVRVRIVCMVLVFGKWVFMVVGFFLLMVVVIY